MPLLLVLLLVLVGVLGYAAGWSIASTRPDRRGPNDERLADALRRREAFLEHLRELAWRDRDVAPELSTILLDEIRTFSADPEGWERRQLPGSGS